MKHNTILALVATALILLALSIPCNAQRRGERVEMYVKIFSIDKVDGSRVEMRGTNIQGDTVFIRHKFYSLHYARNMKVGNWFKVQTTTSAPTCTWVKAEMKLAE